MLLISLLFLLLSFFPPQIFVYTLLFNDTNYSFKSFYIVYIEYTISKNHCIFYNRFKLSYRYPIKVGWRFSVYLNSRVVFLLRPAQLITFNIVFKTKKHGSAYHKNRPKPCFHQLKRAPTGHNRVGGI